MGPAQQGLDVVAMEVVEAHAIAAFWNAVPPSHPLRGIYRRLGQVVGTPTALAFLAGIWTARGKAYIGASARGGTVRYSPMLSVELSKHNVPLLDEVFGQSQARGYYGYTTHRWVAQDKDLIGALCLLLVQNVPVEQGNLLLGMLRFCLATDNEERLDCFEHFKKLQGVTITRRVPS